ncbi:hypothetical protein V1525DRAFT_51099 [Lipomyces kononenkoae]|uniref:Uncharacterized protein n=1 Tax=Lipomyces kononenkoae TaxID=34357 RepID=A0ACC3SSH6_LIPKO
MAPPTRSRKRQDLYSQNHSDDISAMKPVATPKKVTAPESPSTGRVLRSRSQAVQNQDIPLRHTALASPPPRRTRSKNTKLDKIPDVSGALLKENISPHNVEESSPTISLLSQSENNSQSSSSRIRTRTTTPQKRRNLRGRRRAGDSPDQEPNIDAEQVRDHRKSPESLRSPVLTPKSNVELQQGYEVLDTTISVEAYRAATAESQGGQIDEAINAHEADAVNKPSDTEMPAPSPSVVITNASQPTVDKDPHTTQQQSKGSAATPLRVPRCIDRQSANKATMNDDASVAEESQDYSSPSADSGAITNGTPGESNTDAVERIILENKIIDDNNTAEDSARVAEEEADVMENKCLPPSVGEIAVKTSEFLEQPPITSNSPIYHGSFGSEMNTLGHTDERLDQPVIHIEQSFQDSNPPNGEMALDPALLSSPPAVSACFENAQHELPVKPMDTAELSNASASSPTVIIPSQRCYLEFSRRMDKYNRLRSMFSIGHIPRSPSALAFYRRAYSDASSEAASEADDVDSVVDRQESHTTPQDPHSSPECRQVSQLPLLQSPKSDSDDSGQFMDSFESFDVHSSQPLQAATNIEGRQSSDQTENKLQDLMPNTSNTEPVILLHHLQPDRTPSPLNGRSSPLLPNAASTPSLDETAEDGVSVSIESPLLFSRQATIGGDAGDISDFLPEDIIQWEREQRQREACWTPAQTSPLKRGSPQCNFSGRSSLTMGSPMKIDSPTKEGSPVLAAFRSESCTKSTSPVVALSPSRSKSPVKLDTPSKMSPIRMPSPVRLMSPLHRLSPATSSPLKTVSLSDDDSITVTMTCDAVENAEFVDQAKNTATDIVEATAGTQSDNAKVSPSVAAQVSHPAQSIQPAAISQGEKSDAVDVVNVEPTVSVTEESDSENDIYFDSVANVSIESNVSAAEGSLMTHEMMELASDQKTEARDAMEVNETNVNEAEDSAPVVGDSERAIDDGSTEVNDTNVSEAEDSQPELPIVGISEDYGWGDSVAALPGGHESNMDRSVTINFTEDSNEPAHGFHNTSVLERGTPDDSSGSLSTIVPDSNSDKSEGLANGPVRHEDYTSEVTAETMSNEQKEDISEETTVGSSNYFASDENTSDIDYTTVLPWNISLDRWAELNKRQEKGEVGTTNATAEKRGTDVDDFAASAGHPKSPSPRRSPPTRRYVSTPARSSARSSLKRKYDSMATSTIPIPASPGTSDSNISSRGRATRSHPTMTTRTTNTHLSKITETNSKLNTGFENIIIPQYQYKRGKRPESPPPDKRKRQRSMKNESPLKRERKIKFATQIATIAGKSTSSSRRKENKQLVDVKPIMKSSEYPMDEFGNAMLDPQQTSQRDTIRVLHRLYVGDNEEEAPERYLQKQQFAN